MIGKTMKYTHIEITTHKRAKFKTYTFEVNQLQNVYQLFIDEIIPSQSDYNLVLYNSNLPRQYRKVFTNTYIKYDLLRKVFRKNPLYEQHFKYVIGENL